MKREKRQLSLDKSGLALGMLIVLLMLRLFKDKGLEQFSKLWIGGSQVHFRWVSIHVNGHLIFNIVEWMPPWYVTAFVEMLQICTLEFETA